MRPARAEPPRLLPEAGVSTFRGFQSPTKPSLSSSLSAALSSSLLSLSRLRLGLGFGAFELAAGLGLGGAFALGAAGFFAGLLALAAGCARAF